MNGQGVARIDAGPAPVTATRSGTPEAWERPQLVELGELLRSARVAADVSWPDLEAVVGSRSSLRQVEAGTVRTRASRLHPWLERLGVDPDPVLERFAAVIAPEARDGRPRFAPVTFRAEPAPALAPLSPHDQALLGAELWRIRVAAGLTRTELAERIGCSRLSVWYVEHARRRPTLELLGAWLAAVHANQADLELLALRFPRLISRRRGMFPSARRPRGRLNTHPRADAPEKEAHP